MYTYITINKHIHSLLLVQVVQLGPNVSLVVILSLVELFDVIVVRDDDDDFELLTTPDISSDNSTIAITVIRTVNVASAASIYSQLVSSSLKYDLILLFVLLV